MADILRREFSRPSFSELFHYFAKKPARNVENTRNLTHFQECKGWNSFSKSGRECQNIRIYGSFMIEVSNKNHTL